ncbi:MAG: glycogen/starch synthase [Bacteroidales bacterium]|jgi:starch synthase|nr:glycogen/starch synthase [Bacteroidales bacterium]
MTSKTRVLFVHQEIAPYLPETPMSLVGRYLPQATQESGKEIRIFMPRYGVINERRNQLHEVIRLSGMNLIINDTDHPLIIKVASIQKARMQIYFIDNDDFFTKKKYLMYDENGAFCEDNDSRCVFFTRGVIETVKKLNWSPDIIHCHGWISALMPVYIKRAMNVRDNPLFNESKIIYSIYDDEFEESFKAGFEKKMKLPGMNAKDLKYFKEANYVNLMKAAIDYSDGIVVSTNRLNPEIEEYLVASKKPFLSYQDQVHYAQACNEFYDSILEKQ